METGVGVGHGIEVAVQTFGATMCGGSCTFILMNYFAIFIEVLILDRTKILRRILFVFLNLFHFLGAIELLSDAILESFGRPRRSRKESNLSRSRSFIFCNHLLDPFFVIVVQAVILLVLNTLP